MTDTIEVSGAPDLKRLYLSAAVPKRRRGGSALPDLVLAQRQVRVDPAQLADYDRVCGFPVRDRLPATYLHNLVFPLQITLFTQSTYPYPLVGSVHLDNRLTQHRPVGVDETLELSTRAQNARPHRRGVQVDVVSQAHVADELVWEGLATYLYRGQRIEGDPPARPEATEGPDGSGIKVRLQGDLGRRFAEVSGDVNPIHLNRWTAKAMGFPTAIAHGMWSQARMLAAVENRLPDAFVATMEFRKPVLIPGTARLIAREGEQAGAWHMSLRRDRDGTELVRGEISPIS